MGIIKQEWKEFEAQDAEWPEAAAVVWVPMRNVVRMLQENGTLETGLQWAICSVWAEGMWAHIDFAEKRCSTAHTRIHVGAKWLASKLKLAGDIPVPDETPDAIVVLFNETGAHLKLRWLKKKEAHVANTDN